MKTTTISFLTLLLISSFASFCAVVFTPALPLMSHFFQTTTSQAELTISLYLIGYAIGQLLYGPMANHFGRKKSLIVGIGIALVGNVLAIIATFFHWFILFSIARLVAAIGAASGLVISMILIKDIYEDVEARKTFAKVVLAFAFVPFIAIALGGTISHYFNLQMLNIICILYAMMLLVLTLRMPETLTAGQQQFISIEKLSNTYLCLFKNVTFLRLMILFSLGSASSYLFNAIAPVIAIKDMHLTAPTYGWLSIIPSMGILFGGWINTHLTKLVSAKQIITYGLSVLFASSVLMAGLFQLNAANIYALLGAGFLLFSGMALLTPTASMYALQKVQDHANGAAMMNAFALTMCSLFVYSAGSFVQATILTLPIAVLLLSVIGFFLSSRVSK